VNESIALYVSVTVSEWPMRYPLAWQNVFDRVLAARNSLATQTISFANPTASMVFDRLQYHSQSTASQPLKRCQVSQLIADFLVIGPIPTVARLALQKRFDLLPSRLTLLYIKVTDQLSNHLVIALSRCPNEHPANHPTFHRSQRFLELVSRHGWPLSV
jgi:hypothetical protein